ncbi:MAG: sugar phosphate isomerase/epimerase [Clostridia bacterium]|nr:sugar phosphate isomerase/epimerase [Clostridia bacterium]
MNRSIGISWGCFGSLSIGEQIGLMKENGFTATFTGSENKFLDEIMPALRAAGIRCDNYHAPFDGINGIWREGEAGDVMAERLYASVRTCVRWEVPALVVHLSSGMTPPHVNDVGHARWVTLMELADREGVTICFENQRMLSNLAYAFETFPTASFCWDVGHEGCFTPGRQYMPLFGNKLAALHIHDNHGVFNADEHMIPFDGSLDFDAAARMIAASGYTGTIMLELIRRNSDLYADWTPERYYRHAAEAARRIAEAVERYE